MNIIEITVGFGQTKSLEGEYGNFKAEMTLKAELTLGEDADQVIKILQGNVKQRVMNEIIKAEQEYLERKLFDKVMLNIEHVSAYHSADTVKKLIGEAEKLPVRYFPLALAEEIREKYAEALGERAEELMHEENPATLMRLLDNPFLGEDIRAKVKAWLAEYTTSSAYDPEDADDDDEDDEDGPF